MCEDNKTWNLGKQAQEFFVYATLGIVPERMYCDDYKKHFGKLLSKCKNFDLKAVDYNWYCVFMCARVAYNDLCRTLRYDAKHKSDSKNKGALKEKENIINCICATLTKAIYNEGNIVADAEKLFSVFNVNGNNKKHMSDLLDCLKEDDKTKQKIHFGQVQKWVNMTLKYLYLLGIVNDNSKLQIPIDSYIMKALNQQDVPVPNTAWSRFDYKEYENLCNLYKDKIDMPYIEWEHDAWIIQAEKEKGVK